MSHPLSVHILVTTTVRGGKYSTTTMRVPGEDLVVALGGVGVERLGAAAHRDHDFADHARADPAGDPADLAHHLLVSHAASLVSSRPSVGSEFMGEMVEFASNGGTAKGYLATPAGGRGPGVLVIQEWWGLVPHIEDVCERFAAEGFVALAPDLYHGAKSDEPDEAGKLMMALNLEQAGKDLSGAVDLLRRAQRPGRRRRRRLLHGWRPGPGARHPAARRRQGGAWRSTASSRGRRPSPTGRSSTPRCSATSPRRTTSSRRRRPQALEDELKASARTSSSSSTRTSTTPSSTTPGPRSTTPRRRRWPGTGRWRTSAACSP